jgi:hypothetical protein
MIMPFINIGNYSLQRSKICCENSAHSKYSIPCQIYFLDGEKFAQVPSLQERTSLLSISQSNTGRRNMVVALRIKTMRNYSTKQGQILGYLAMP